MIQAARRAHAADDAAAGAAGRDRRQRRAADVRADLLPAVVPAGAVRQPVRGRGSRSTASATVAIPAPARRDPRPRAAACWSSSTRALTVQIVPTELPVKMSLTNIRHPPRRDAAVFNRLGAHPQAADRAQAVHDLRAQPPTPAAVADRLRRRQAAVAAAVRERHGQDRRRRSTSSTTSPSARINTAGVQVQQTSIPGYPGGTLAAQVLGTVGQITRRELKSGNYPDAGSGRGRRPDRARSGVRPVPARPRRQAAGRDRRPGDPDRDRQHQAADRGPQPADVAGHAGAARRPGLARAVGRPRTAAAPAARSSR